jgi:hypothetical protein
MVMVVGIITTMDMCFRLFIPWGSSTALWNEFGDDTLIFLLKDVS